MKNTKTLLFQVENYTVKTDIFRYYLLENFTILDLCYKLKIIQSKRIFLGIIF